jgi:GNAT superfamily N-acetyltransferase
MSKYTLVSPRDANEWATYHDIRRRVLFEARGQFGVYNANHPDDTAPGNHAKLLVYGGDAVGVVRIDVDGPTAIVRRMAIREDMQRRGHGRALIALIEQFAYANGCHALASHVAPDAVEFYLKCGFSMVGNESRSLSSRNSVFMTKRMS